MPDEKKELKTPEAEPQRRPAGAKRYDEIVRFLTELKAEGSHAWPLDDYHLLSYIGPEAWVAVVNFERAEGGKEPLDEHTALGTRAKAFG